jgi:hypothetical protein
MRIGIIGGWGAAKDDFASREEFSLQRTPAEFASLCHELGRRLGELGQAIIVGAEGPETADHHVVKGFIEGALSTGKASPRGPAASPSLISVIRGYGRSPFEAERERYPDLFTTVRRQATERGMAKLIAVQEADAVITIAGFSPTLYAGIGAHYSGKRVVPVPLFGGASRTLLEIVEQARTGPEVIDYGVLDGPSGADLVERVLQVAGVGRPLRVMIVHGHSDDRKRLQAWLIQQRCEPLMMIDEYANGKTFAEKFEQMAWQADGAIALATPDDLGGKQGDSEPSPRARQNVWLEVGWFWGYRGRERIIVLTRAGRQIEVPSDYSGIELYGYAADPTERAEILVKYLDSLSRL